MTAKDPTALTTPSVDPDVTKLQFLQTQVSYLTSHLQIADAKAAGVVAYVSVLGGYTANKLSAAGGLGPTFASWLAVVSIGVGAVAIALAFLAVIPRGWAGTDPRDVFSWAGRSNLASSQPYPESIGQLTHREMQRSLADSVETSSLIVRRKYRLVAASIITALVSTLGQGAYWILA